MKVDLRTVSFDIPPQEVRQLGMMGDSDVTSLIRCGYDTVILSSGGTVILRYDHIGIGDTVMMKYYDT